MLVEASENRENGSPISKKTIYVYLEIANRLNMKAEVKRDGGEYYIELV